MGGRGLDREANEKDRNIIDCLINNPHASVKTLSKQVGYPPSTVQKRVASLIRTKRLGRILRVEDWGYAGYPLRYRVDIKINQAELRRAQADAGGSDEVHSDVQPGTEPPAGQRALAKHIKQTLAKAYAGSLIVEDIVLLLGQQADVSIIVRSRDANSVFDFVTNGLQRLDGVEGTMTSHEAWSC